MKIILINIFFALSSTLFAQEYIGQTSETFTIASHEKVVVVKDSKVKELIIENSFVERIDVVNSKIGVVVLKTPTIKQISLTGTHLTFLELVDSVTLIRLIKSNVTKLKSPFSQIKSVSMDSVSTWERQTLEDSLALGFLLIEDEYFIFNRETGDCQNKNSVYGINSFGRECVKSYGEVNSNKMRPYLESARFYDDLALQSPSGEGYSFLDSWLVAPRFQNNHMNNISFRDMTLEKARFSNFVLSGVDSGFSLFLEPVLTEVTLLKWTITETVFKNARIDSLILLDGTANSFSCIECVIKNSSLHFSNVKLLKFKDTVFTSSELNLENITGEVIFENVDFLDTNVAHLYKNPKIKFINTRFQPN